MNWNIIILTYISFLNFAAFLFLALTTLRLWLMYRIVRDRPTLATMLFNFALSITWLHSVVVSSPAYQATRGIIESGQAVSIWDVPFSYIYRAVSLTILFTAIFYFDHTMRQTDNDY